MNKNSRITIFFIYTLIFMIISGCRNLEEIIKLEEIENTDYNNLIEQKSAPEGYFSSGAFIFNCVSGIFGLSPP